MTLFVSRRVLLACALLAPLAVLVGCERAERIESYTVRKPAPPAAPEATDRTVGAIVALPEQGWFFKLTGPKDAVAAAEPKFATFLKSVHFNSDGKPEWTLPEGWQHRPGNDLRYATLVLPPAPAAKSPKPLEVSVTMLPKSGDDGDYALVNINRWRNQLQLPPISKDQLAAESSQVQLDGATATMVNLVGAAAPGGMGGPFSGGGNGK
jgi:hypothetical protein